MTGNPSGSDDARLAANGRRPEPTDTEAVDRAGATEATWAETVVGGVPADPAGPGAEAAGGPDGSPGDDGAADAEVIDGEVVEAEVIDAEPADAEVVDGEVVDGAEISVEDLVVDLERVTVERDQFLDASRRLQAEFENYKKQVAKREAQARERANDALVGELLPVLDAFDGAVASGAADVEPMRASFLDVMAKQGLERIEPLDAPFDPNLHEAVMHEDASDTDGPVVAEVMRAGYVWKGRVLRPAMVRTRG